jgi:hypothetical protein
MINIIINKYNKEDSLGFEKPLSRKEYEYVQELIHVTQNQKELKLLQHLLYISMSYQTNISRFVPGKHVEDTGRQQMMHDEQRTEIAEDFVENWYEVKQEIAVKKVNGNSKKTFYYKIIESFFSWAENIENYPRSSTSNGTSSFLTMFAMQYIDECIKNRRKIYLKNFFDFTEKMVRTEKLYHHLKIVCLGILADYRPLVMAAEKNYNEGKLISCD